ncbi:MAG: phage protein Gp37 [Pseudomonadota bacterium]
MAAVPGYTIEQIEDAFVSTLQPMKSDGAVGLRTLKTYQGELSDPGKLKDAFIALFPAILVVYGGSRFVDGGARKVERMRFTLFACDRNLRGEEAARRGSGTSPGAYAICEAARDRLFGSRLGLKIEPLELLRQDAIWFGQGISVYSQDWETGNFHLFPAS